MQNVDISFAYFDSGPYGAAYLFAYPESDFRPGESTTDILSAFGFGSGAFTTDFARSYPIWIKDMSFYDLPSIDNLLTKYVDLSPQDRSAKIIKEYVDELYAIIRPYYEHKYCPERAQFKRAIRQLCKIIKCDITEAVADNIVQNILYEDVDGNRIVPQFSNGYAQADTCCVTGVDRYGKFYIQIGMTDFNVLKKVPGYVHSNVFAANSPAWKYACQSGSAAHVFKTLWTMNTLQYSANHDDTYLKTLSDRVRVIYPYIY